jgi:hypothetical protein
VNAEIERFMAFNFPDGAYETAPFEPVVTQPESGTVRIAASTTIPTTVMSLFGFETLPLDVVCDASLSFVNTDVVLVLDVTGSMRWNAAGTQQANVPLADQRITALREAVMALYDELEPIQEQLEANNLRLRFGIVPYSSSVNVGQLINDVDPSYMRTSAPYQSRHVATRTENRAADCTGSPYYGTYDPGTLTCHYFEYTQRTIDTSEYLDGDQVDLTPVTGGATPGESAARYSEAWRGCIEERRTVTITPTQSLNIPAAAYDLDINRIPNDDDTRWVPHWPQVVYPRDAGSVRQNLRENGEYDGLTIVEIDEQRGAGDGGLYACPAEARRLRAWTRSALQSYVDGLIPVGSTYHDIGMIWGARFISSGGIFADSPDEHNGMPVARHIIFMTDGEMAPNAVGYSAYGIEQHDRRVVPNNINLSTWPHPSQHMQRHSHRFRMVCNATKGLNVSIWAIAFGTGLNDDLRACASNDNQASASTDRAQLIERFREIGSNIGALRLTQ